MYGVGDVGQGLTVDLLVPAQHLPNGLVTLLDLGPAQPCSYCMINNYNLTPEQRVTDLELEFRLEVLHIRDLGPVTHVLEHLVGLVESMLCGEGFQPLGINILLNEIVKIRECINIYK